MEKEGRKNVERLGVLNRVGWADLSYKITVRGGSADVTADDTVWKGRRGLSLLVDPCNYGIRSSYVHMDACSNKDIKMDVQIE